MSFRFGPQMVVTIFIPQAEQQKVLKSGSELWRYLTLILLTVYMCRFTVTATTRGYSNLYSSLQDNDFEGEKQICLCPVNSYLHIFQGRGVY